MLRHWSEWRPAFEEQLTRVEIHFLHAVREIEGDLRKREEGFRADWLSLHQNYEASLREASADIQQRLWADLERLKADQERMIQTELRVLRRKVSVAPAEAAPAVAAPAGAMPAPLRPAPAAGLDYARFEERFRGDEAFVSANQQFYLPVFEGKRRVLDLGCGRGELLRLLADRGADVSGVDLDPEALAACREKGLSVEQGDLYAFLAAQPDASCDGLFCAHVVEHLPAERLQELADLAFAKLRPGGVFALETPNPGCLAIFAGDFYLDPRTSSRFPPPGSTSISRRPASAPSKRGSAIPRLRCLRRSCGRWLSPTSSPPSRNGSSAGSTMRSSAASLRADQPSGVHRRETDTRADRR